jgi:hypothetical protein
MSEQFAQDCLVYMAAQSARNVKAASINDLAKIRYEAKSSSLRADPIMSDANRMSGQGSAPPQVKTGYTVGGTQDFEFHVAGLGLPLRYALFATVQTVKTAQQEIKASAAFSDGVAFGVDTNPEDTSPAVNPAQLEINLSGLTGSGTSIVISGTDNLDNPVTETITISGTPAQVLSKFYYKTIDANGITINGLAGTVQIDGDPVTWTHTLTPGSQPLTGMTIEVDATTWANTYWNCEVNEYTLTFPEGGSLQAQFGWMGTHFTLGKNITGVAGPLDVSSWTEDGFLPDEIYATATHGTFSANNILMSIASATLAGANNLTQKNYTNAQGYPSYPKANNVLPITYTAVLPELDPAATGTPNFEDIADADDRLDVEMVYVFQYHQGPEVSFKVEMRQCQISQFSGQERSAGADVERTVICRPTRDKTQFTRDEIKITLVDQSQDLNLTGYSIYQP